MARSEVQPHVWVSQWTPETTVENTQDAGLDPLSRTRFISRTMFECEGNLPSREWHGFIEHFMDELWVPSVWNKQTWAKSHIDPDKIKVLGEGLDFDEVWNPSSYKRGEGRKLFMSRISKKNNITKTEEAFIFLSIFKWEDRKGWQHLLEAFITEFSRKQSHENNTISPFLFLRTKPNVKQYMKFLHRQCSEVQDFCDRHIYILDSEIPFSKLPLLYLGADAFALPTHGEGWGRPVLEAVAMALPVIATNFSGLTAFLNPVESYVLPVQSMEPCGLKPNDHSLYWASIDTQELRRLLRLVLTEREEAKQRAQKARITAMANFNQPIIVQNALQLLQEACAKSVAGNKDRDATRLNTDWEPGKSRDKRQIRSIRSVGVVSLVRYMPMFLVACIGLGAGMIIFIFHKAPQERRRLRSLNRPADKRHNATLVGARETSFSHQRDRLMPI